MQHSICDALMETLSSQLDLSRSRLQTLALLIFGMVNARTVNLSHLASQFPGEAHVASSYRRLQRFFQHETGGFYLPSLVGANFRAPVTYDREIRVCVQVAQWLERRFKLEYQVFNMDGVLVATGYEWRAWAQVLPEGRLKGAAIAEGFRQRLEGNGAV